MLRSISAIIIVLGFIGILLSFEKSDSMMFSNKIVEDKIKTNKDLKCSVSLDKSLYEYCCDSLFISC